MEIGISTACFYPQLLEDSINLVAACGASCAELFFNTFSEIEEPAVAMIKKRADAANLRLFSVHPFTSLMEGILLFSIYNRRSEEGLELYRHFFHGASQLGAKCLTLHGERRMPGAPKPTVTQMAQKFENYRRLCSLAMQEGITVAQENVVWCQSADPEFLKLLYREVPELRFTFDVKQARRAGKSWKDYLPIMGERLINVHISDYTTAHSCLLPGEGKMEFEPFLTALKDLNFNKQAMIEVYSTDFSSNDQVRKSLYYLQNLVAKVY